MASESLERLKSQVLTLSEPERAELAHDLIQSLDAPSDEGVDEAWDAEIQRRLSHIDAGTAKLVTRDGFRKQMRDRIGSD
ncbi:MAG: addiction module protein [Arenicellales bacterium]|jgi:putative addiction module component (TIGR02574 family)